MDYRPRTPTTRAIRMLTLHEYRPSQNCWKVRVPLGILDRTRFIPTDRFSHAKVTRRQRHRI